MMQQIEKIIIVVMIAVVAVSGLVYFWQQKNDVATNASDTLNSQQNPVATKHPAQNAKTSLELMRELIIKNYPNDTVENYKIFEEIKSPYSSKTAVLFGLDTEECCSEPIGIFINNQGRLGDKYDILQGALQHLYLDNVKWQDDKTVLYDFVIFDEGGKEATQRSINIE